MTCNRDGGCDPYEIRFLRGRVKFLADGRAMHPAPFPSMIVIFRGEPE